MISVFNYISTLFGVIALIRIANGVPIENAIIDALYLIFLIYAVFFINLWWQKIKKNRKVNPLFQKSKPQNIKKDLAKELSAIYDSLCMTSKSFQDCNSDFIQLLHRKFEEDEKYKNFKLAVLSTCWTQIDEEIDIFQYVKELSSEINKLHQINTNAIQKYDNGSDFWKSLADKGGEQVLSEVSYTFYMEHFLIAQEAVLNAWLSNIKNCRS